MKKLVVVLVAVFPALFSLSAPARGDVNDLNSLLPLRVEDATVTQKNYIELQTIQEYERSSEGESEGLTLPTLQYGLAGHSQLELQVPIRQGSGSRDGSGDIEFRWLYSPIRDRVGLAAEASFPTGKDSQGVDPRFELLLSQPVGGDAHRIHLNLLWDHNTQPDASERPNRYEAILGYSVELKPSFALVADLFREQQQERDQESQGLELGAIWGLGSEVVLAFGGGVGLGPDSPDFVVRTGFQVAFGS